MKAVAIISVFLIACTVVLAVPDSTEALGVRISGGYSYVAYGDYNNWADYVNSTLIPLSGITGAKIDNINWIPEFRGELLIPGIPLIESGIGAGIIMGSADFSVAMPGQDARLENKIRAYPITYTAYFDIPVPAANIKPIVYGGFGAYYSKITFTESTSGVISYSSEAELTDWGFGLHGGAGIAFSIAPTVTIDLSIFGRWADIKGYEGTYTDSEGASEDVYLVYDEIYDFYGFGTDDIYYGPLPKELKGLFEEGSVNLSGYGFTLGLRIGF